MGTCASNDADSAEDKEINKAMEQNKDKDENKARAGVPGVWAALG